MNTPSTFGERLRFAREQNHLSQMDLAVASKMSQNSISRYERGTRQPKTNEIRKICCALKISANWLLSGKGEMHDDGDGEERSLLPIPHTVGIKCPHCLELEAELKLEREERRALSAENRQLHTDKEKLLLQVMDLTNMLNALEVRLKARERGDNAEMEAKAG